MHLCEMKNGSFNWCFKVVFDDGAQWAVRFPVACSVMHLEEKVQREVAVMRLILRVIGADLTSQVVVLSSCSTKDRAPILLKLCIDSSKTILAI